MYLQEELPERPGPQEKRSELRGNDLSCSVGASSPGGHGELLWQCQLATTASTRDWHQLLLGCGGEWGQWRDNRPMGACPVLPTPAEPMHQNWACRVLPAAQAEVHGSAGTQTAAQQPAAPYNLMLTAA